MSFFSTHKAMNMFNFYNRQLLSRLVEQQVAYYTLDASKTTPDDLYGESDTKFWYDAVVIDSVIEYTDQQNTLRANLPDEKRTIKVSFWKAYLIKLDIVPMKGDCVFWNDDYYEVYTVVESNYFTGKVPEFSISDSTDNFGGSLSVVVECKLVSKEKIGIS